VKNKIKDINQIGGVIAHYYTDSEKLLKLVRKNESVEKILEKI